MNLENFDYTLGKPQTITSELQNFNEIFEKLSLEKTKTEKLELKLQEKEKVIEELQNFNKKIRVDYEQNQKDLLLFLEEKNHCIEVQSYQIESLAKKLEKLKNFHESESKTTVSPLSKSKLPFDMTSTKSSFKNSMNKSCKSQRSLNFDAYNSQCLEISRKKEKNSKEINDNEDKSQEFFENMPENAEVFHGFLEELFSKILKLLSLNYLDEILPKMKSLLEQMNSYEQFHDCLGKAIIDCSPDGLWNEFPSVKQQWKWVKNVMIEYMNLKKNEKKFAMSMSQFVSPKLTQKLLEENAKE